MAAPALRHDELRTEATLEDVRRGDTATRQRPPRSAHARPVSSRLSTPRPASARPASERPAPARAGVAAAVAVPLTARPSGQTAPRPSPRPAPHTSPREEDFENQAEGEHHEAARRKVRRGHKARSLPTVPFLATGVLLGQVLLLLYVNSLGMASTHASDDLDKKISSTTEEIKQNQKRISAATSKHQMEVWAAKLQLRQVQQSDIDRVNESARPVDSVALGEVQ